MLTSDVTRRLFRTQEQFREFVSPGPRSSTGYSVQVLSVTERNDAITVKVRERTPSLADHVEPRITYPYRLLSLPAGEAVYVDWAGR